ncbi:uncharacterized protein [Haliotis cracherodii]|uniref:uncharacterized protein n=1 Tax=Haliotis cracherodii TaxID=6455 RepID=UPI0039E938D6
MGFLTSFLGLSIFVLSVSGFRFRCHRDICDSSYQFCNDGEERCNTCTPEQCQADVAKHILNQCEVLCLKLATTTVGSTEPTTTSTAIVPAHDKPQESHILTYAVFGMLTAGILALGLIVVVLWYVRSIDGKVSDLEKGESVTYSTVLSVGDEEKTPLLEQGIQAVQNEESDSGAHMNKLEEIRTLAQAPAQATGQIAQPHQPDPPSYTTSDLTNDKASTISTITPMEAVQDSGIQDHLSEKIPETEFLQQNLKAELSMDRDIKMENTQRKSVPNQSQTRF